MVLLARRTDALKAVVDAATIAHKESGIQGGGKIAAVRMDVSDKVQVATLFDQVPKELRDIDVLGTSILIWYTNVYRLTVYGCSQ